MTLFGSTPAGRSGLTTMATSFNGQRDRNSFEYGPQPQSTTHPNKLLLTSPNCGNQQGHRGSNCPGPKHQCTYCQILGHQEPFCFNKQKDKGKYAQNSNNGGKKNFHRRSMWGGLW
jgi:hypothetical protein